MSSLDKSKFERRGDYGCSNSHYVMRRTTCCKGVGVEDEELLDFYFDPDDLTKRVKLFEGEGPCPLCGATDWGVEEFDAVPERWAWSAWD